MSRGTYDTQCHNLALYFLDDAEFKDLPEPVFIDAAHVLAQHIQKAVEDFLEFHLPEIIRKENAK